MKNGHMHPLGKTRLLFSIVINLILTVAQIIGGVLSGSLALISDALHNFTDASSLGIAYYAITLSDKPPDKIKTFGYERAEIIAALINYASLILIGFYLICEAIARIFEPKEIIGWVVVWVAVVALLIDIMTAILTYSLSKKSINIKAAFLHNISDALSSIGVILVGTLVILYQWHWADVLVTILIAGYVLYQGIISLPKAINILMNGAPENTSINAIINKLIDIKLIVSVHHVHVWHISEKRLALEAHIVVDSSSLEEVQRVKDQAKLSLNKYFNIEHSTLEFERAA